MLRPDPANGGQIHRTEFRWIRAHQGVIGNEIADRYGEEAAQGPERPQKPHNQYIHLAAAVKRRFRGEANIMWQRL